MLTKRSPFPKSPKPNTLGLVLDITLALLPVVIKIISKPNEDKSK